MATLKEAKNKKQSESNEQMSFCESIDVLNDLCVDGSKNPDFKLQAWQNY